jgi:hypothetical protein
MGFFALLLSTILAIALQKERPEIKTDERLCTAVGWSTVILNCALVLIALTGIVGLGLLRIKSPFWFIWEFFYIVGLTTTVRITPALLTTVLLWALLGKACLSYRRGVAILAIWACASGAVDFIIYSAAPRFIR